MPALPPRVCPSCAAPYTATKQACKEHNLSVQDLLSGWTHDAIRFAVERVGKRFTPALTLAPSLAFIDDDANVTSGKKGKRVGVKAKVRASGVVVDG